MSKTLVTAAFCAASLLAGGGGSAQAAPITYTGSQIVGDVTASYSITTNGTIGEDLFVDNILSFSATLANASGTFTITNLNGDKTGFFDATPDTLSASPIGDLAFESNAKTGGIYDAELFFVSSVTGVQLKTTSGLDYKTSSGRNDLGFATAVTSDTGAVPEPATWATMILGLGAIGFAMRRRGSVRTRVSYAG